jgi:hypothetical protein
MTLPAQILERQMREKSGSPVPDELILQQLGTAVLLCWPELPIKAQERILEQSKDMVGFRPIVDTRKQIVGLLMRHKRN